MISQFSRRIRSLDCKLHQISRNISAFFSLEDFRRYRNSVSGTIGFVPTMGYLHHGHGSLIKKAKSENNIVIGSIFVNPTQFGPKEDYDRYPRNIEGDLKLLEAYGADAVLIPSKEAMYGPNFKCFIDPVGFDQIREGISRPGHFRGVATIVSKLFNLVLPTNAYFGQKDAAQCVLIKRLAVDMNSGVNVVILPTIREVDGLACSSRNSYLTENERKQAPIVYKSLLAGKDIYDKAVVRGDTCIPSIILINGIKTVLNSEKAIESIDYISIASTQDMTELDTVPVGQNSGLHVAVVSLACRLGKVRLIDNILI